MRCVRLIYTAISGFGHTGPKSSAPAYDPIIQAQSDITATQGKDEPAFFRTLICYKITAYTACQAVTSALYMRKKTGEGQHIDLSMSDAGLFFIHPDGFQNHTLLDEDVAPQPLLIDRLYALTVTKDCAVTISAGRADQQMRSLIAMGMEHLLADERFYAMEKLIANIDIFKSLVALEYLKYATDEVIAKLQGPDVPCARCFDRDEVLAQEQLQANGSIDVIDHPLMGSMRVVKAPRRFGGEALEPGSPSPDHGQYTRQVLETFSVGQDRIE
ncbi:MAG: crotonobetainyl-CoA:carnitine CoA-transferase CaiB-like acyl-CoA transferase [Candidatus Azotimanducaceae bacterium]|jgi:crotonobetainyl-CoA:carnitine CoA-transferase CaiB-like acyl-CoA transferase